MSDTPRTDADEIEQRREYDDARDCGWPTFGALFSYDLCRQLERELAAANARISQLANALDFVTPSCAHLHHPKRYQHKAGDPCPVEEIIRKAKQTRP
jgi:hypothetical protein